MTRHGPNSEHPSSKAGGRLEATAVLSDEKKPVEEFQEKLMGAIKACGYDDASTFAVRLSLEEAMANGFRHGNQGDPKKTLKVSYQITTEEVRIEVEDQGSGFDPEAVPDPTEDANLEIPSGRGIMLIRAYMTEVRFHPPGNRMEMVFRPGA